MPLRLANYQDAYGTTHLAAYAVIERIATDIPPNAQTITFVWITITFVWIYVDAAAEAAGFDPLEQRKEILTFNPLSDGAGLAAYTELSQLGGIYEGSIIV
jgi:hypothetical protein